MPGIYAEDGSHNVTVVGGGTPVGAVAPDGSRNVTIVNEAEPQEATQALSTWYVAAVEGAAVSHTGDTNETVMRTVTIPGGSLGPNGCISVTAFWTYPNSANNKTLRMRLGAGIAGTIIQAEAVTTTTSCRYLRTIINRNAENSQIIGTGGGGGTGTSGSAVLSSAIDTTADFDLTFTAQLALGSETVVLEYILVEVLYKE